MATKPTKNKSVGSQSVKSRIVALKKNRIAVGLVGAVVVLAVCGGTAAAANSSKPGDSLYGIDIAAEKVRLAFSFTDSMKETARLSMAKERLEEIQALFGEKDIDAPGIAVALANFEEQSQKAASLAENTDNVQEVEGELTSYKSEIDKLFEGQQTALENERESLKKQAETAEQAGNTALAAQLRSQAGTLDDQLKLLETKREASKQQQEKYVETLQLQAEDAKEAADKQREALSEAVKQEVEAQSEAAKKLQEQQQEADKKAQEQQQEDAKKAAEQEDN